MVCNYDLPFGRRDGEEQPYRGRPVEVEPYRESRAERFRTGLREGLIFDSAVLYRVKEVGYDSPELHGGSRPYNVGRTHIEDYSSAEGLASIASGPSQPLAV